MRALLAEPTEYIASERGGGGPQNGSRRVVKIARYLPPRVHLRPCASNTFVTWILLILVFVLLLDVEIGSSFIALFGLGFIYLTFRATSEPVNKLEELQQLKLLYCPSSDNGNGSSQM